MKMMHTDLLFVVLNDLASSHDRGEISREEYLEQSLLINSEIHERIVVIINKNDSRICLLESSLEVLKQECRDNSKLFEAELQRYEQFLLLKNLSEEFEEWEWEQVAKGMEEKDLDKKTLE